MIRIAFASLALLVASPFVHAAPDTPLSAGTPRSFALGGNAFTDAFYFDAPADAAQIQFEVSGNTDLDLLVRYGTPFPGTEPGATPTPEYLLEGAQYRSISGETSERIAIGRYNVQPARAGRWYIVVLNFDATPSNASVRVNTSTSAPGPVPINVVFDDGSTDGAGACSISEWNDPTPATPAGGNSGTTVGAQRRNAVLEAARLLSNELRSPVPIKVKACWTDACDDPNTPGVDSNRCTATGATLAFASAQDVFIRAQSQTRSNGALVVDTGLYVPPRSRRPPAWTSSAPRSTRSPTALASPAWSTPAAAPRDRSAPNCSATTTSTRPTWSASTPPRARCRASPRSATRSARRR